MSEKPRKRNNASPGGSELNGESTKVTGGGVSRTIETSMDRSLANSNSHISLRINDLAKPKHLREKASRYRNQAANINSVINKISGLNLKDDYLNIYDGEMPTPGPDYNLPSSFGRNMVAGMKNSPSFGMIPRSDSKLK